MSQRERDMNLIMVATVEEYGRRHQMKTHEVLSLFRMKGITKMLRAQYEVLHMMDLSEGADMVEDLLNGSV